MSNNCSPTPNDPCRNSATECKDIVKTACILYTGTGLSNLNIVTNTSLDDVLDAIDLNVGNVKTYSPTSANASTTLTAAQIALGYITSTLAGVTTLILPTGTLLGTLLGAVQGTTLDFFVDNTAGSNTVTIAVGVNAILSALAVAQGATFGLLTIPIGVTGTARFTIVFTSATAYTFSRTA